MKFELIEAKSESSKIIIANLMQLYKYNLSIYEDESTDLIDYNLSIRMAEEMALLLMMTGDSESALK